MNTSNMIDVTGYDLITLVKNAFKLSTEIDPQTGIKLINTYELTDDEASQFINHHDRYGNVVSMNYYGGRRCNFNVWKDNNKLYIRNFWPGHTEDDLKTLLEKSKNEQ